MTTTEWHRLEAVEVLRRLGAEAERGLSAEAAAARLREHGPNELQERGARSPWRILWEQFTATMVLILLAAAALSAFLQKWTEATSILAIVALFGLLGFLQEYRAERAMAALKKLTVPVVRARRDGTLREISARELAPGDVIVLEAGSMVPADVRLIEAVNLRIQEAALTGESEPVEKESQALDQPDLALGDRRNLGFMGTVVTYGRGAAVVTATGMRTELGRIASLLQEVRSEMTPLQQRLDQLGKSLAAAGAAVAALILLIGVLLGEPVNDMILTAISVAVAVVPEGLPAVVTFTLALGAQRMLRRNALIRKLPAVETLGSVTVICSDKTGTLTENRMTVVALDVAGRRVDLDENMRGRMPAVFPADRPAWRLDDQPDSLALLLAGGALCNDAQLKADPQAGHFRTVGDPTEAALLVAAALSGLEKDRLEQQLPRVAEIPFDSDRKRMTTVHAIQTGQAGPDEQRVAQALARLGQPYVAVTKGSVDGLLEAVRSSQVWADGRLEPLTDAWRARIEAANEALAQAGMRVLGLALRPLPAVPERLDETAESGLVFVGLIGMIDPPRPEVRQAVSLSRQAGIRPVMITGDHPLTARAIAQDLGILPAGAGGAVVLTGQDLDRMPAEALRQTVESASVFARVSPEHKLRIVEALQDRGHIVAMTGDGVNDAPALKRADIGVAMGIAGTDVSKEAAEMVLRDDNFATLVAAVQEGRVIYDNVRRFVKFSIAGNIGKVGVMLLAPLAGINVALLPLQLLWLNLLTDGLLGLGMGVEPAEENAMRRPPHSPRAGIFSGGLGWHVLWVGALMGALALGVGAWYYHSGLPQWQTMIFTSLAFQQVGQALASRSARESLFRQGLLSNRLLAGLAAAVLLLQAVALYVPALDDFFKVTPLGAADLLLSVALGGVVFAAIEFEKWLLRRRTAG